MNDYCHSAVSPANGSGQAFYIQLLWYYEPQLRPLHIIYIALQNVLTMVNDYTRQFWKELEEPTQSEKINPKKKHYAFRQTTLLVQTSPNCWEMSFQLVFIPDVKGDDVIPRRRD